MFRSIIELRRCGILLAVLITGLAACSDSSVDPPADNVRIEAGMTTSNVPFGKMVALGGAGTTVDSLRITSVKFLISEIKLQSKDNGTEVKVKTGPALLVFDQNGARATVSGSVPAATYNKVSVKIHRLKDDERATFLNNADFADFIGNDRNSVMISGIAYDNGQAYPFTYGSKVDETIKLDFADVSVNQSGMTVLVIQIDPVIAFKMKDSLEVLDPRDAANASEIDKAIKTALKAIRK